jgi:hypothetical protein
LTPILLQSFELVVQNERYDAAEVARRPPRIALDPSTVVTLQHMAYMTWLFTLPVFLMMLLFAIARASEGFGRTAPRRSLYVPMAGRNSRT